MGKSYTLRIFCLLFAVLLAVLCAAGTLIYVFARQTVGEEFLRLNNANLEGTAASMGKSMTEIRSFGQQLSVDSSLLTLADGGTMGERQAMSALNAALTEFVSSHQRPANLLSVAVLGRGGLRAASYNQVPEEHFSDLTESYPALLDPSAEPVLLPVSLRPQGAGVMVYTFRILLPMRSYDDTALRGVVVLDVSELFLYSQYRTFLTTAGTMAVVDEAGTVISSADKTAIGQSCGVSISDLTALNDSSRIMDKIQDGDFLLSRRIPGTAWYLYQRLPARSAFAALRNVRNIIFLVIGLTAAGMLLALLLAARTLMARTRAIEKGLDRIRGGDLSVRLTVTGEDEFGRIERSFNEMAEQLQSLIDEVRHSEQRKRAAEIDFLHAQINSHFIHNTLTSIRFLLEMNKTEEAGEMLFYFSKLLRQTLSRSDEFIPLSQETDALENYVNLQRYRYPDTFEATFDLGPDTDRAMVPSMILQPVVENAIFHGTGGKRIQITLTARREGENLTIVVADDGVGMSDDQRRDILQKESRMNHVGLRNVHERIQMCYGSAYGLSIESAVGQGTKITYTLPYWEAKEEAR